MVQYNWGTDAFESGQIVRLWTAVDSVPWQIAKVIRMEWDDKFPRVLMEFLTDEGGNKLSEPLYGSFFSPDVIPLTPTEIAKIRMEGVL